MCPRSLKRIFCVALALLVCPACKESPLYPPNGTLTASLGGGLTLQTSGIYGNQIMTWTLEVVEIQVPDQDLFNYLQTTPCEYIQNVAFFTSLGAQCGVEGYVLNDGTYPATINVTVSAMRVYRAGRPPLPDGLDCDQDEVLNEADNCQLIPNPQQEDINMDGFGDACSLNDPNTGQPTIPDRDGDGIADFADNCVYIANTDQDDINAGTFLRGIGDACRQEADVTFASPAEFSFDISAPIQNGDITFSLVDFSSLPGDMSAPVKCDTMTPTMCVPNNDQTVPLGMCSLDESLVEARAI